MITIIATAFKEKNCLPMFIGSLLSQTNSNWKAIIFHNGLDSEMENIFDTITDLYPDLDKDNKLEFFYSEEDTKCWGAKNRNFCIQTLVTTSHVINTSIQDYLVPTYIEEISKHLDKDFIYWNSINHIFGYHGVLNCEPVVGRIDWGNFCIKTEIAKKVGINYPSEFCGDGYFVRDCMTSGLINSKIKLPQILTIHN